MRSSHQAMPINPNPADTSPDEWRAEDLAVELRKVLERLPVAEHEVRPLHVKLRTLQLEVQRHM